LFFDKIPCKRVVTVKESGSLPRVLRFAEFKLDTHAGELRNGDLVLQLPQQPLQILYLLLEHPGELVSRAELRSKLWPDGTYLDFEDGLNHAVRRLRDVLDDSPENPRFIQTIPRRGYRFIYPIHAIEGLAKPAGPQASLEPAAPLVVVGAVREPPLRHRRRWWLGSSVGALALAIIAAGVYLYTARGPAIDSIAVLPFANVSGNPNIEYLCDGITDSLINSLSQLPRLQVRSRDSAFRYRGKDVDPQDTGRDLGVRALVTGRILQRGNSLLIGVELIDTRRNSQIWGEQYNRQMAGMPAVEAEIAREISEKLRLRLTGEDRERLGKPQTANSEAYQLYLQGRYYWNERTEEGFKKSIEYFNQATDIDAAYALAYAGLADSYFSYADYELGAPRDLYPRAVAVATKALELDPGMGGPHATLGYIKYRNEWDWAGAEREFKRAIELSPNDATAHDWFAVYLSLSGRHTEAAVESRKALQADPLSWSPQADAGLVLYYARHYDQATEQYLKALDLGANFHPELGSVYLQRGRLQAAIEELQKAEAPGGQSRVVARWIARLGYAYARAGNRLEAQKRIEELEDLRKGRFVDVANIAIVYAGLGNNDQAFAWFDRAEQGSWSLVTLKVDPIFDPIRSDPRFAALVRRVGIP
jgi:TolB-like protein/DNA-binding winged helix-turn-helix (wHTH) protein/Flp pilus assembly protein TadD